MLKKSALLPGALLFTLSAVAHAEGLGLGLHAGLMGTGVDGFYRLNDKLVARLSYNAYDYDYDTQEEDVDYDATYHFDNVQLGLDWYPGAGGFRLSTALVANGNELDLHAVPKGNAIVLNDTPYASSEVKNLRANVSYPATAAYLGLGWGNPVGSGKGFGATFDIGAFYTGAPEVTQQIACGITVRCSQIQKDAEADRRQLEDDLSDFTFWPLVQLGLTYQF